MCGGWRTRRPTGSYDPPPSSMKGHMLKTTLIGGNRLLATLPEEDLRLVQEFLSPVRLKQFETLHTQGDRITRFYFPISTVVSSVAILNDGATSEISLVGREGMTGVASIFGDYEARNWTRVLIPGEALRIQADDLRQLCAHSETLHRRVLGCYRSLITQVSQRAVCNCRHTLVKRLATWLLMVHDRVGADDLVLTQETVAGLLGARRAGVTQAARLLLAYEVIRYSRGRIHISDRLRLEEAACECYRVHAAEFYSPENTGARTKQAITGFDTASIPK